MRMKAWVRASRRPSLIAGTLGAGSFLGIVRLYVMPEDEGATTCRREAAVAQIPRVVAGVPGHGLLLIILGQLGDIVSHGGSSQQSSVHPLGAGSGRPATDLFPRHLVGGAPHRVHDDEVAAFSLPTEFAL